MAQSAAPAPNTFGWTLRVYDAIPLAAGVLMALHFWRVRKDGGISGPM